MRGMAIRAHRRLHAAAGDSFAVHAIEIIVLHATVARPACVRDIRPKRRTLRILVTQYAVRPVATHAVRSHQQTLFAHRISMDGVHVRRVHIL